jgi:hypothetical protein
MNCWCQAELDWMDEKFNVFQSLVFYYLQIKKFIPTISEFFTKDWILPVESYPYGVLLANTDYITWQSEYEYFNLCTWPFFVMWVGQLWLDKVCFQVDFNFSMILNAEDHGW